MLKAVIFDFDGIIIDSEPLWVETEKRVFKTVGVNLTDEMCSETTGLDTHSTIKYWHKRFPWDNKSRFQVYKEIMQEIDTLMEESATPREGILDLLQLFVDRKMIIAVASSSPAKMIINVLKKYHIFEFFKIINSSENEQYGKPHPAVYLNTALKLGVSPEECLAFEDSLNGAISAKAARMQVVAVPCENCSNPGRFDFADLRLSSLSEFNIEHLDRMSSFSYNF